MVNLRSLSLYSINRERPIEVVLQHLSSMTQLSSLTFSSSRGYLNIIHTETVIEQATAIIAKVLEVNKTLIQLDLRHNVISDIGGRALAKALKVNGTLTHLDLEDNEMSNRGCEAFAVALKVNKTLTLLNLGRNRISVRGAEALAEALKVNKTLTQLKLESNKISVRGSEMLAEALRLNKTLTQLDLGWNGISDRGSEALAEALKVNKTLTQLGLGWNRIADRGSEVLAEALKLSLNTINLLTYYIMATQDQASLLTSTTPQKNSRVPPSVKRLRSERSPEDVRTTFIEALKSDLMLQRAVADIVQTNPDSIVQSADS
ncbi:unnamed protein product [Didymodactylos carnosus]|uniref:Uncharacterized protein n=1 Tax=Didymodactylos carnosus TaxID=1234261 RepID=A0A8S2DP99_9BILA|nr:unnamed protein product [Didymodactylos carnosus]CAF3719704.1 unnamed protein product [Didymodactylos carnosus]